MNTVKNKLREGRTVLGSWLSLGNVIAAEIMCDAGFDWLAIDLEHTTTTLKETENLIRVIDLKGCVPLVRLTSNDSNQIKRVLDAGAGGVIVPSVASRESAEQAVSASRYPPAGTRGVGLGRAQRYGPGFDEYFAQNNLDCVVIAQIESHYGVSNLREILAVNGVDATMIGPYDLSASIGVPGDFANSAMREQLGTYESVSRELDVPMGAHIIAPDHVLVHDYIRRGYRFVALSADFLMLGHMCRREMAALRGVLDGR